MNKYQEALKQAYEMMNAADFGSAKRGCEALKVLQELVDKATPKKVSITELHHVDAILKRTKCPQCSNYTYAFRSSVINFCRYCGQRLE